MLSQVHDELNFEVHESIPMEEAVQVIDAAMSFRGVVDGWADVPADIEIGDCYGKLKGLDSFGIDLDAVLEDSKVEEPDTNWFFEQALNLARVTSTGPAPAPRNETSPKTSYNPPQFKKREDVKASKPVAPRPKIDIPQQMSQGRRQHEAMMQAQQQQSSDRVDLSQAKFPLATIVLYKLPSADDDIAYKALQTFITDNFGTNDLVLENEGRLYKFPADYRVSDNLSSLEGIFEIRQFKAQPKIKLQL